MRLRTKSVLNLESIRRRGSMFAETLRGEPANIPHLITEVLKSREHMTVSQILTAIHHELGNAFELPSAKKLQQHLEDMSDTVAKNKNGSYTLLNTVVLR